MLGEVRATVITGEEHRSQVDAYLSNAGITGIWSEGDRQKFFCTPEQYQGILTALGSMAIVWRTLTLEEYGLTERDSMLEVDDVELKAGVVVVCLLLGVILVFVPQIWQGIMWLWQNLLQSGGWMSTSHIGLPLG